MKTNLRELKVLQLKYCNNLLPSVIQSICELVRLEELDLSYCKISDSDIDLLFDKLSKLQMLKIAGVKRIAAF